MSEPPPSSDDGVMAAGVIATILVLLGIFAIACLCDRIQELQTAVAAAPPPSYNTFEIYAPTMEKFLAEAKKPVRFTAQQLCIFTNNYKTQLGSGGFATVYKGQLPDGVGIAVKVLSRRSEEVAERQFMAEVGTIGRTYHINVVQLYGFCFDYYMSALVYEYMENGSLDNYLFRETEALEWGKLHEIAIGTAKGIAYLHEECEERIIHYDIKPANILLDSNFSAKVADFGLAKLCNRDNTHDSVTAYRGTPGYAAPEFLLKNYSITHKCDVYGFGMVLFEIVGRRRNAIVGSSESMDWFPKHVWDAYEKGKLAEFTLACKIEEKDKEKAEKMCMIALWCVQDSPEARPPMSAVVKMLEGGVEIMAPPMPFRYLFSVGMEALKPSENSGNTGLSGWTSSEEGNSQWYREKNTPIMRKYEIQIATL